MTSGNNLKVRP